MRRSGRIRCWTTSAQPVSYFSPADHSLSHHPRVRFALLKVFAFLVLLLLLESWWSSTNKFCAQTADFWGPASNFGIPIAAVMDTQKDPEMYAITFSHIRWLSSSLAFCNWPRVPTTTADGFLYTAILTAAHPAMHLRPNPESVMVLTVLYQ
jgi:hypothetical protein